MADYSICFIFVLIIIQVYIQIYWSLSVAVIHRYVSNIRRTLVGSKFVDHSDVVGASPIGAAPTTSSLST